LPAGDFLFPDARLFLAAVLIPSSTGTLDTLGARECFSSAEIETRFFPVLFFGADVELPRTPSVACSKCIRESKPQKEKGRRGSSCVEELRFPVDCS
jgi:hypothetical protein